MKCKYLEHQVCIRTDGQYRMCCVSVEPDNKENVRTHTPIEWLNSETVNKAKSEFSQGKFPDACIKCKINEENGVESMRQKPRQYGPGLSHLDLRFGNSCNLGCVMCFPGSSSTLHYEHEKLKSVGIESPWGMGKFEVYNWYNEDIVELFSNLTDLREVYLTGGEPMMVKHLSNFLEKLDSSVELRFNTNGTILNHNVLEQLKRFDRVSMCYSIDGIGKVNDYIRYNSKWEDIEHNIETMSKLKNVNISIGPTIQILNALYYKDLKDWADNRGYKVYDNILIFPKHFNLSNAHNTIKESVPEFKSWTNVDIDMNEYNNFVKYIKILDKSRNISIIDYLPEVAEIYGFD